MASFSFGAFFVTYFKVHYQTRKRLPRWSDNQNLKVKLI